MNMNNVRPDKGRLDHGQQLVNDGFHVLRAGSPNAQKLDAAPLALVVIWAPRGAGYVDGVIDNQWIEMLGMGLDPPRHVGESPQPKYENR